MERARAGRRCRAGPAEVTVAAAGTVTLGLSVPAEADGPAPGPGPGSGGSPEPAQPVYTRYWMHGKGPAPAGNLPVAVHLSVRPDRTPRDTRRRARGGGAPHRGLRA